jgi:hypothetical protein
MSKPTNTNVAQCSAWFPVPGFDKTFLISYAGTWEQAREEVTRAAKQHGIPTDRNAGDESTVTP